MIVKVAFGKDQLNGMFWTARQDPSRYKSSMKPRGLAIWKLFISYCTIFIHFSARAISGLH